MSRKAKTVAEGWVPLRHGIASSYNRGCRCDECRAANTTRMIRGGWPEMNRRKQFTERVLVDGRLVHPTPYGGHGSVTAYTRSGCRCAPCTAAMSEYRRSRSAS